ncbi:YigZ family protein [Microbispora sp. SCL1-1]|uniref:YigZ family protein n=1 Tax=Microbispora TaxID=2005 RepID=UPI00115ABB09|nr:MULTISPECIES: YigZ family protein [unclassified Microbispora]NJP24661.1 YigZ family protein [Microbispora sp. CL1-1]TQS14784.1 YigZ family protein [Microbispora sp. SCL1-1]
MAAPYQTIKHPVEHEIEVRRSRFICALAPAATEEAARAFVAERRRRYADATHNCTAYVVGERVRRADDDGEPGGTAGTPMLEMLTRRGFADVVAVVTRYFGGVLLGAGGLARAYGGAVGETLDRAEVVEMVPAAVVTVSVGHAQAGRLESDLRASPYALRGVDYGSKVAFEVAVAEDRLPAFEEWIASLTAGRADTVRGGTVHLAR